ncbi:MAG: acyloxyacyl hydrolase [Alphaproteobacteria bacterium]
MTRILAILAALILAAPVGATAAGAADDEPDFLSIGAGWYDFNDDKDAVDGRIEYRSNWKMLGFVKPWAGVEFTSDAAFYGVAGVLVDIYFGRRVVVTPSFGVGAYADGDGKDLGNTIEFRSQIELGYRFDDWSRVSLAVGHISNAGLGDSNPGTEIATIYYHMPLRNLFGE